MTKLHYGLPSPMIGERSNSLVWSDGAQLARIQLKMGSIKAVLLQRQVTVSWQLGTAPTALRSTDSQPLTYMTG
jgi:hypothetical protein